MHSVLIINGPNLNLLGQRQPEVYGATTLDDINKLCMTTASELGLGAAFFQSNHEGELIDAIHSANPPHDGIIINAGAYTHTSVAIMDALSSVAIPAIEIHLSNIFAREDFRHHSYLSPVVVGQICGFGVNSYVLGIQAMAKHLAPSTR